MRKQRKPAAQPAHEAPYIYSCRQLEELLSAARGLSWDDELHTYFTLFGRRAFLRVATFPSGSGRVVWRKGSSLDPGCQLGLSTFWSKSASSRKAL
jgi:hypothetical protein